jgi:hypothetical protein
MRAKAGQNALAARHFQAVLEQSGGLQGDARRTWRIDWRRRRPG